MDKMPASDRTDEGSPLQQPVVLTPGETRQVAGGLNPQPLPPGEDRLSAKSE
jgi:hypothetical protein